MERIKEEGHNLNISRYIGTAMAESEVDLAANSRRIGGNRENNSESNDKTGGPSGGVPVRAALR